MQYYISGAQSVGKTTLIRELLKQLPQLLNKLSIQIDVIDEVARSLIKQEAVDLDVFQDYRNHQEEFYQFNLRLVKRYLEMARLDRLNKSTSNNHQRGVVKLYDRSGLDAISYIVTYLPHLADRMLTEPAVRDLLDEYSNSDTICLVVIDPHDEFMVLDNVRLPPCLEDLLMYTKNLRQMITERGIKAVDLPEPDLNTRVRRVCELIVADWGEQTGN